MDIGDTSCSTLSLTLLGQCVNNHGNILQTSQVVPLILSHVQNYHTPLLSLDHTPHKLSKHVGAIKRSLMAIYCVLDASH